MSGGHTTIGGGDTQEDPFDLDPGQVADIQAALRNLSAGHGGSDDSSEFGSSWQNPSTYNVYHLGGGTTVPFAPVNTDAVILDGANGSVGASLSGSNSRTNFWVGNQGNDTFSINAASQTIIAGDGDNSIFVNSQQHGGGANEIAVRGGHDTIQLFGNGTINAHDLAGGGNSIFMQADFGGGPTNSINVGDGNDTVTFAGSTGSVLGGNGDDSIDFSGDGQVSVGSGNNTIHFAGGGSIFAGDGSNRITTDTGETMFISVGNGDLDLRIHGSNGSVATTVVAGGGSDNLVLGSETVWGMYNGTLGGGNDTVTLGLGRATISNSGGSTHLDASHSTDLNYTGFGTDNITLGAGSNLVVEHGAATVTGGSFLPDGLYTPSATVQGGSGSFVFTGHDGHDSVTAGSGAATLTAGNGNGTFHAGASSTALLDASGASGNNALFGGSGSATLLGGSGYSLLQGGSGNTSMVGGSSWNFFTGGSGNDTMVANTVATGSGADPNVFNFEATVGGHHEIDGYNSTAPGGDQSIHLTFTNYGLTSSQIVADSAIVGSDTVITLPGTGAGGSPATTITIKGYTGIADWNVNSH